MSVARFTSLKALAKGLALQPARADRRRLLSVGVQAGSSHRMSTSEPAAGRKGTVRPSKTAAKGEAKQFAEMSRELARLSEKQLARLEPILGETVVTAVSLAARISHRNQGRQRQEGLVARMLRETAVEDGELKQLRAALDAVQTGQGIIANPAVVNTVELWLLALLAGEAEATTKVFGLLQAQSTDLQQVRQLLRNAQQTEPAAAPATPVDDVAADVAAEEGQAAADGGGSGYSGSPERLTSKARSARKQLRKLLAPVAELELAPASEEEE